MVSMNMQEIWQKDARKPSYDSMYRTVFVGTYNAIQEVSRPGFD